MPVQDDKSKDISLLQLATMYAKSHLFLINRVDRPVSGIVMLAKKKEVQAHYSNKGEITKTYVAIVKKGIDPNKTTLTHYLKKDGRRMRCTVSEEEKPDFKESSLEYELMHTLDNYDMLRVTLQTGRFHQIRAQLSYIGHPVKGDVKYGARRKNKDRSIHLHAHKISFKHPKSGKLIEMVAPIPQNDGLWKSVAELIQ